MPHFVISLDNVRLTARIGVFGQERIVGNEYIFNVKVKINADGFVAENLDTTLSYADIFSEVKSAVAEPRLLLETVASDIASRLRARWPSIVEGSVSITKSVPPISGYDGSASVCYFF